MPSKYKKRKKEPSDHLSANLIQSHPNDRKHHQNSLEFHEILKTTFANNSRSTLINHLSTSSKDKEQQEQHTKVKEKRGLEIYKIKCVRSAHT